MKERKEITVADVAEAKEKGLNFILDNLEVSGTAVIRGKDGKIKQTVELTEIREKSVRPPNKSLEPKRKD